MTPAKTASVEPRTILVRMTNGLERRISNIPGNAKVTFSKMIPKDHGYSGVESACLRIYTSESNQLAVFVGVKEFQDSTLTVETKMATKKERSVVDERTGEMRSHKDEEETTFDWVEDTF